MCALSCNLRSRQWQSKEGVSPRNTLSNPKSLVEFRAIYDKCYYNNSNKYKENVLKQSYFRISCSWSIETVPYWYDHNKYYTMNKHEQQGLALWGHISNSYCFKKELHCIQFTLTEGGTELNWYIFETFWCYIFQPPTETIKWDDSNGNALQW